jgi:uncharacterized protein (TIGR00730 family)
VNNLSRLKPSNQERYRVTIFGSARAKPGTYAYDEVKRIAAALATIGCDIITGGGPGLMQAANEGAAEGSPDNTDRSVGIRVDLPFEQELNPFVLQAFEHRTFFTRLHQFVLMSDAFIVVPGGIGTVLELMMIWQLLQVQHVRETPLILVGTMWEGLLDWAKSSLLTTEPPLVSMQDVDIPQCVQSGEEAIVLIRENHAQWLASRNHTATS